MNKIILNKIPVITIDGPSYSGKGTLCCALAKKLQWNILDSGIFYRILALIFIKKKLFLHQKKYLVNLAKSLEISFKLINNKLIILLNNKVIFQSLKDEKISYFASKIALIKDIRDIFLEKQRKFRLFPGLVVDGRDTGSKVFPDAIVKIFLYASLFERTKRRINELNKKNLNNSFQKIFLEIQSRDSRDRKRIFSPLIKTYDMFKIDSTLLTIKETYKKAIRYIKNIFLLNHIKSTII